MDSPKGTTTRMICEVEIKECITSPHVPHVETFNMATHISYTYVYPQCYINQILNFKSCALTWLGVDYEPLIDESSLILTIKTYCTLVWYPQNPYNPSRM